MRQRRLRLDPYTGDPVEDARYHGIPVENHRRLSGGKRKRSSSPLRKEPRKVTRIGTYVLSVNGARFAIVRRIDRVDPDWRPLPKPASKPVTLVNRDKGQSVAVKRYEGTGRDMPSVKSDASGYVPSAGSDDATQVEWSHDPNHRIKYGL